MQCRKSLTRLQWSLANSDGISFPFDGIPFVCVGTINYQCHQGDDVDRNVKMKRTKQRDEKEVILVHRQCIYTFTCDIY